MTTGPTRTTKNNSGLLKGLCLMKNTDFAKTAEIAGSGQSERLAGEPLDRESPQEGQRAGIGPTRQSEPKKSPPREQPPPERPIPPPPTEPSQPPPKKGDPVAG